MEATVLIYVQRFCRDIVDKPGVLPHSVLAHEKVFLSYKDS